MSTPYAIQTGIDHIDFPKTTVWLASTYWSPGIPETAVRRAANHSALVLSAHHPSAGQVAYARVVSDKTTFAWICDVFVDPAHRQNGLARQLIRTALIHPEFQNLRRWLLATRDAHNVYAGVGFQTLPHPERWMVHIPAKSDPTI